MTDANTGIGANGKRADGATGSRSWIKFMCCKKSSHFEHILERGKSKYDPNQCREAPGAASGLRYQALKRAEVSSLRQRRRLTWAMIQHGSWNNDPSSVLRIIGVILR